MVPVSSKQSVATSSYEGVHCCRTHLRTNYKAKIVSPIVFVFSFFGCLQKPGAHIRKLFNGVEGGRVTQHPAGATRCKVLAQQPLSPVGYSTRTPGNGSGEEGNVNAFKRSKHSKYFKFRAGSCHEGSCPTPCRIANTEWPLILAEEPKPKPDSCQGRG